MKKLRDPEYRHAYADEHLNLTLSTQIKVLREQRKLSQSKLARDMNTQQAGVSRLESIDYSRWSISTLRKLAKAFDLRLKVTFEEFGTLWSEVVLSDRKNLERASFDDDRGCLTTKPSAAVSGLTTGCEFGEMKPAPWHEKVTTDNVTTIDSGRQTAPTDIVLEA